MSGAAHVYTLTCNLLAERTLEFAAWSPGKTQRATRETFQVGGKGINVSKMLTRLGAANTALLFTGGATGAECEDWLHAHQFTFHAFATDRATRSGAVVRTAGRPETTFLGPDVPPSAAAIAACAAYLDARPEGQILAFCGSAPGWNGGEFEPLRRAFERWISRGTLVADTYGPPLAWFAARPLALVKINAVELAQLIGSADSLPQALFAPAIASSPVQRWVITDGPKPVWFRDRDAAPASLEPPRVREVSATGSGDVLFASLLHSLFRRGESLHAAVAAALPLAAANAAHPGIAEFPGMESSQ